MNWKAIGKKRARISLAAAGIKRLALQISAEFPNTEMGEMSAPEMAAWDIIRATEKIIQSATELRERGALIV